jgi:hypothetical protein
MIEKRVLIEKNGLREANMKRYAHDTQQIYDAFEPGHD